MRDSFLHRRSGESAVQDVEIHHYTTFGAKFLSLLTLS